MSDKAHLSLMEYFCQVPDPRILRTQRHELLDISSQQKVIRYSEPNPFRILSTSSSSVLAVLALNSIH